MSDLLVDLAEAKQNWDREDGYSAELLRTHHATIQQNAEDAKRLRALERAMDEKRESEFGHLDPLGWIKRRADEILREGEPHDQD